MYPNVVHKKRTNENADRSVRLITIVVLHQKENHKEQIVSNTVQNNRTEENTHDTELKCTRKVNHSLELI